MTVTSFETGLTMGKQTSISKSCEKLSKKPYDYDRGPQNFNTFENCF